MAQDVRRSSERAKRLPRAVREKQILDAAVEVFSQHGYHMASMDVISEVAGVSKPMIYSYLGAKEELFGHCIRRESNRLFEAVRDGIRPDVPPDMQLWHGLRSASSSTIFPRAVLINTAVGFIRLNCSVPIMR